MKLNEALRGVLSENELELVPRSFDIVGDIAIMEVPKDILKKKKVIAEALMKVHPRIKTVCNKKGERCGDYRLADLEVLIGKETETEHIEFGCRFRTDVKKAYFSVRESTERQRIAKMIKPGEDVLVMFSGVCPSPIVYAKLQPKLNRAYGVELNPAAHKYAVENVRINKLQTKVFPVCGDVRKACPELGIKFDRITMPLPKGAHEFLDTAFEVVKKGGIIHFYYFDFENALYDKALEYVRNASLKAEKKVKILDKRKVLPYGPRAWKICIEFKVLG